MLNMVFFFVYELRMDDCTLCWSACSVRVGWVVFFPRRDGDGYGV